MIDPRSALSEAGARRAQQAHANREKARHEAQRAAAERVKAVQG